MKKNILFILVVTLLLSISIPAESIASEITKEDIKRIASEIRKEDIKNYIYTFSSFGSRVVGYPGNRKAANFILNEFKRIGLKRIEEQHFTVTAPIEKYGRLTILKSNPSSEVSESIKLHLLWPNLVRTSTLPPGGVEGQLIYGGDGDVSNFRGKDLEGSIVLLDFNSGRRWVNASMLGARAVIFIEPEDTTNVEADQKFLSIPLNVPRFWIGKEDSKLLMSLVESGPLTVRVEGRMDWEEVKATNILGYIEGSDPKLKNELIVLSSHYDSMSVVPALSPGAENAAGITALLKIACIMKRNPPSRSVLFLATSAHFIRQAGITDFCYRHLRKVEPFKSRMEEPIDVELFIGLNLSSGRDELGIWHGSREFHLQRFFAPFGKKFENYRDKISAVLGRRPENTLTNGIVPIRGITWETLVPQEIKVDGRIVLYTGTPALNFVTIHDARRLFDTPLDRPHKVNYENLTKQIRFLACVLLKALNDRYLFPESALVLRDKMRTLNAKIVTFNPLTSFVPRDPVKGALACLTMPIPVRRKNYLGMRAIPIQLTDENGVAVIRGYFWADGEYCPVPFLEGYYINDVTGEIELAPNRGVDGDLNFPMRVRFVRTEQDHTAVIFPSKPINLYDLVDPTHLVRLGRIDVFNKANTLPTAYGYSISQGWREWSSDVESEGVVFAKPNERIKVLGSTGLGRRLLLLNSTSSKRRKEAEGIGFLVQELNAIRYTPYQGARDMLLLSEYRISNLERYGIENRRLNELHKNAKETLKMAGSAKENKLWDSFLRYARRAGAIATRAYPDVKATSNDVIAGIIFYMLILLPFAYFTEKLIFSSPDIRKQLAGIFGIFLIIYWIMREVHPAFELARVPEIILLGFILLALSGIVISFISGKFEEQMGEMRRKRARIHQTDVGRIAASSVAFNLGVSNMKKRKVRTTLTAVTLILLTFTVLSFTAVRTHLHFNKILRPNEPLYQGILITDRNWSPLQTSTYEHIKGEFSGIATVVPRAWYISQPIEQETFFKVRKGEESTYASSLLGLRPEEDEVTSISKHLKAGRWFQEGEKYVCILPEEIASFLGIGKQDVDSVEVNIFGQNMRVIGILNSQDFENIKDLNNEPLTPVSFSGIPPERMIEIRRGRETMRVQRGGEIPAFPHTKASTIPIIPYDFLLSLGGTIQSIAIKFNPGINVTEQAEDFISRLGTTIFVGEGEKTHVYSSIGLTSLVGLRNLLIPILIASLIVLNTMLGSVYERVKEIGTYSSVGLAPTHIGSLFIAESCVYAVLGAVGGYLVGQVMAKIMTTFGVLEGITLNYSSVAAVASTLIVMTTVVLSTLYPAKKAAAMAVPDVTRKWALPEPKGDLWEFDFPFTISGKEVLGLYIFFENFFDSYSEESIGKFYTSKTKLTPFEYKGDEGYAISMVVHLAPFDIGVSQEVHMKAIPTGEYEIYVIQLIITRKEGEIADWKRLNRRFLDTIRKQFLIWRTVPPELKQQYIEEGRDKLKFMKPEIETD